MLKAVRVRDPLVEQRSAPSGAAPPSSRLPGGYSVIADVQRVAALQGTASVLSTGPRVNRTLAVLQASAAADLLPMPGQASVLTPNPKSVVTVITPLVPGILAQMTTDLALQPGSADFTRGFVRLPPVQRARPVYRPVELEEITRLAGYSSFTMWVYQQARAHIRTHGGPGQGPVEDPLLADGLMDILMATVYEDIARAEGLDI